MPRKAGVPAYREKLTASGRVSVVTLRDAATGKRKDVYVGPYGSPESREAYTRAIAAWETAGRTVAPAPKLVTPDGISITQICAGFLSVVKPHFSHGEYRSHIVAIRELRKLYANVAAESFEPKALKAV